MKRVQWPRRPDADTVIRLVNVERIRIHDQPGKCRATRGQQILIDASHVRIRNGCALPSTRRDCAQRGDVRCASPSRQSRILHYR